ncbi:MAG TPA: shikimate kinase [Solibacterales bacterium]|nr:shikimate kinase [Bryobacterales bacterium]
MILKLKRTPGIYLVGFMGSGKSTVGKLLARELGWPFCDVDAEIEKEQAATIASLFETRGEPEFREIEHAAIQRRVLQVEQGHPCVVALGGGAFAEVKNRELLENNGVTIWLDPPFHVIKRRVEGASHRPLARDPVHFERLYLTRRASYELADYHIVEGESPAAVAAILKLPLF